MKKCHFFTENIPFLYNLLIIKYKKNITFLIIFYIIKKSILNMRKKIPDEEKRKKVSFSIDPRIYDMWIEYCKKYEIENYSEYFEKIIKEKLKNNQK